VTVAWVTGFLDSPAMWAASTEVFWRTVTGSGLSARRGADGRFATLLPADGDAYLRVQVVDDPPVRCHLDLHTADVAGLARAAVGAGAVRVFEEDGLVVCRSPAGLPFCVVRWHGERVRPRPAGLSLVDQMCLDIPVASFEAEAAFWAGLTGWERRPAGLPEFDVLVRPDGMPLRLLLQRTGGDTAGMHLDLACDDVDAEVARHLALGAAVVRRIPGDWTTLRDPSGREYCVTARPAR
jgi:hypothetical protein